MQLLGLKIYSSLPSGLLNLGRPMPNYVHQFMSGASVALLLFQHSQITPDQM